MHLVKVFSDEGNTGILACGKDEGNTGILACGKDEGNTGILACGKDEGNTGILACGKKRQMDIETDILVQWCFLKGFSDETLMSLRLTKKNENQSFLGEMQRAEL